MKLVAGLGNPGKEYEHTRHNMGFDVIDELARRWAVNVWKTDMKAEIASVVRFGEKILLVKPLTYMNPILWRVCSYSLPGFPSPATNFIYRKGR